MNKPPLYAKLWAWMLLRAEWRHGKQLGRGQFHTTIDEMREAMSWNVGYRKVTPTKKEIRAAYEWFARKSGEGHAKGTKIGTTKGTRGMVITILNYDYYQTPSNYEGHDEKSTKGETRAQDSKEFKEKRTKNPTTHPSSSSPRPIGPDGCPSGGGGFSSGSEFGDRPKPPPEKTFPDYSPEFLEFMDAYGEESNDGAWSAWCAVCGRHNFTAGWRDTLSGWLDSERFTKDGGQYKPDAKNFLREGYWQRKPPKPVDPYDDGWVPPEMRT